MNKTRPPRNQGLAAGAELTALGATATGAGERPDRATEPD
jgi:hypothetical protein